MRPTLLILALASLGLPARGRAQSDEALGCARRGDHACVIRLLDGHTESARELELLIASLRAAGGHDAEIERNMRLYLSLYPSGRMAAQYRQYLAAHAR